MSFRPGCLENYPLMPLRARTPGGKRERRGAGAFRVAVTSITATLSQVREKLPC